MKEKVLKYNEFINESTNESRRYSLNEGMNLKVDPAIEKADNLELILKQELNAWRYVSKPIYITSMNVDIKSEDEFDIELQMSNNQWISAVCAKGKYNYFVSNKFGTETYYKVDSKTLKKYFSNVEPSNILNIVLSFYEHWLDGTK